MQFRLFHNSDSFDAERELFHRETRFTSATMRTKPYCFSFHSEKSNVVFRLFFSSKKIDSTMFSHEFCELFLCLSIRLSNFNYSGCAKHKLTKISLNLFNKIHFFSTSLSVFLLLLMLLSW